MSHEAATDPKAVKLYKKIMSVLIEEGIHFMVGGGISLVRHANIERVHDLDIFCRAGDYPRILYKLQEHDIEARPLFENWIAQVRKGGIKVDFIYSSPNNLTPVDDEWFAHAKPIKLFDMSVLLVPPEEVIWTKVFIQARDRYDMADVHHIILHVGHELNWHRLLNRFEPNWELLLSALINYRYVFPSERDKIPKWVMDELVGRLTHQLTLPAPADKTCRGIIIARSDYEVDVFEGGFHV